MTSVYGVTLIGARDQVRNRLKERGAAAMDEQELFDMSNYGAKVRSPMLAGLWLISALLLSAL